MAATKPSSPRPPVTIGWREHVSLPDLGISEFVAKMDTGANYCALHATDIHVEDGYVVFRFEGSGLLRAKLIARKTITSSNGESTKRPLIRTRIKLGRRLIHSEITLIDRSKMKDKMLLGRKLLKRRFIIDPTLSYALSQLRKKRKPT